MSEGDSGAKSQAERWFDEQVAWQKTMREYSDALANDEQFLVHLGNAMRGSLLAGTAYPQPDQTGATTAHSVPSSTETLDEILFTLKRIDGRLRDLEDEVESLRTSLPSRDQAAPGADD